MTSLEEKRLRGWTLLPASATLAVIGALVTLGSASGTESGSVSFLSDGTAQMGIVLFLAPLLISAAFMMMSAGDRLERKRLLRLGIRGTATFVAVTHPTRMTGAGARMGIEMEILVPGRPAWRMGFLEHPEVAGHAALHPDAVFDAVVDPQDPHRVLVDWTVSHDQQEPSLRTSAVSREPVADHPSGPRRTALAYRCQSCS
jgi:phosphate/sulfate permease